MASSYQITVGIGTLPVQLINCPQTSPARGPAAWFTLANGTGGAVYVGGAATGLGTLSGYLMGTSTSLTGYVFPGDQIYGYTTGTTVVSALVTGAAGVL